MRLPAQISYPAHMEKAPVGCLSITACTLDASHGDRSASTSATGWSGIAANIKVMLTTDVRTIWQRVAGGCITI
jgi:hypothetical protein